MICRPAFRQQPLARERAKLTIPFFLTPSLRYHVQRARADVQARSQTIAVSHVRQTTPAEWQQFVAEQLKSGHYQSASDVVAQSLGRLRAQEEFIRANTAELRKKIASGLEQIRHGETSDRRTAIQNLRTKLFAF